MMWTGLSFFQSIITPSISTYSLYYNHPYLKIILVENIQCCKEFNQLCPTNSSDDLCLLFCLYCLFLYGVQSISLLYNPCAGEFEKMTGEFGGMGNYVWGSCGRRYVGYFKANQPDGHGELKFPQVRAQLKVFSFRFRVKCWLFGHWSFGKKAECFLKQI